MVDLATSLVSFTILHFPILLLYILSISYSFSAMTESGKESRLAEQHYLCPNVFHSYSIFTQSLVVIENHTFYFKVHYY